MMTDRKDLKVVELDPDCKPQVGALTDGVLDICHEYCDKNNVTLAEAIGVLEIVKYELIEEARDADIC